MEESVKSLEAKFDQLIDKMRRMEEQQSSKNHGEVSLLDAPPNQGIHSRPLGYLPKLEFPVFDGIILEHGLKRLTKYFQLCKINDDQKMSCVSIYMCEKAEAWFDAYTTARHNVDWGTLCLDLSVRFRDDGCENVVEEFNKLTQLGTLEDYLDRFEELMALMIQKNPQIPDSYFLDSFIDRLKPRMRK